MSNSIRVSYILSSVIISMSSSSAITEGFEPPPVFLASLKLASIFDLEANFRLFHFFLIYWTALLIPYTEFTLVGGLSTFVFPLIDVIAIS